MSRTIFDIVGADATPAQLSNSVVIVIDAQNEYVFGHLRLPGVEAAVEEAASVLRRAREAGAPVIHIVQLSTPERPLFTTGTPLADIIPALQPLENEVVIGKQISNAFAGTDLADAIRRTGRTNLILTGFMTHNCVTATARSAEDHGFRTTIVAAATASRDLPDPVTGAVLPATLQQASALAALADRTSTVVARAADLT